jgi:predicted MFS family arabinose efflux permease
MPSFQHADLSPSPSLSSLRRAARSGALWALGVIFAANLLNYIDRTLVSALGEPIRKDLHLRGWEFGLLWTLFTVGYLVCAVPIGLLADRPSRLRKSGLFLGLIVLLGGTLGILGSRVLGARFIAQHLWVFLPATTLGAFFIFALMAAVNSRTRLFSLCIVVWSIATVASGLAQSKLVLYTARVFIGVGEAGCLVIGPVLISDYFSLRARGRALSIFYLGLPLGGTLAFVLAGALLGILGSWRTMFYLAGAPGFLVAALIWALPDPPRGAAEGSQHGVRIEGLGRYLELLKTPTLLLIILGQAFAVFFLVPVIHFGAQFFEDQRQLGAGQARIFLGLIVLVGGGLGTAVSGLVGDRFARRHTGAYSLLAGVSFLLAWPCLLLGFTAQHPWVFLPATSLGAFFIFTCMPAVNTQIANVVSPAQRATAWALAVMILHLLGDTLSAPLFGFIQDRIGGQPAFLRFSCAVLLAAACCLLAACTARTDVERVTRRIREAEEDGQPGLETGDQGARSEAAIPAAHSILPESPRP